MAPLLHRISSSAVRLGMAAQNALEVARFGGLDTGEEPSPFDVVGRTPIYRLRHYFPAAEEQGRPPVLLVPPLMLTAEVYDVAPRVSGVAALDEGGVDPWVVDFGAPEREEGGLQRTLADHVLAVSDAVDRVRRATGRDVHLAGYSQGGMFAYQTAAYRQGAGLRSLVTFGSPVDVTLLSPAGLPMAQLGDLAATLADTVLSRTSVPAGLSRRVFQLLDPMKTARARLEFLRQLHNRDALLEREGSRRFLESDGWVAWPGPAVAEFASQFLSHNRMLSGGFAIGERMVTLADITIPTLAVVGEVDEIAAAAAVRAVRRAAPEADIWELVVHAGHMGLVVGHGAREDSWPVVAEWIRWQEGEGPRPAAIAPLTEEHPTAAPGGGVEVAAGVALNAAQLAAETTISATRAVRGVLAEALDQLPRLARLERSDPDTRVSLALLLEERARRNPDDTFFLFQGRGYSYAEALRRVDAITRGLLRVGVRQGEHVGVLMGTRPTALATVAALSRIGAVAVMLRPGGDLGQEVRLGQVGRVLTDPDLAREALAGPVDEVLVLGTGGDPARTVPDGAVDMEPIDPATVVPPAWYEPNPGRSEDLAVIVFTGTASRTRATRITNRRWAVSAFGTASAASLGRSDTVYAATPLHHPATLLTAVGGAVVSGARLAVGAAPTPEAFWGEVRRYGVTVVTYTWTMVADLLAAPPTAAERHHPIRLFVGSGMPRGLWERVIDRLRPARVLEFYTHTEGEVVLANLSRDKVGAMGRPLPGTAEVAVAAYDVATGRLEQTPTGFVRRADPDEPGMLLARARVDRHDGRARLLRGVFAPGDAWLWTGDLFLTDADGDLWLLGDARSVISTEDGPVFPNPVQWAIEADDAVDLCAVYGVRPGGAAHEVTVAAVTTRPGRSVTDEGIRRALAVVEGGTWPTVIRVLDGPMPRSAHHRIQVADLREEGIPPSAGGLVWDGEGGAYVPLTPDRVEALGAGT